MCGAESFNISIRPPFHPLCQISKLVIFETLEIILVEENFDALFDVANLGNEATADLVDSFADELGMLHLLSCLHDSDDGRLKGDT